VGDLVPGLLVEVIADTRPVRQQMLDRDVTADEREIPAQHRARGRRQAQRAVVDQADHRQRGQPLRAAGDREPGVGRVRYLMCAVSEPVRLDELGLAAAVHGHDAREAILVGNQVDYLWPRQHSPSVKAETFRWRNIFPAVAETLATAALR